MRTRPQKSPPATRFTPPAEFRTVQNMLDVRYAPARPAPRAASATPVDPDQCARTRGALLELTRTYARALRRYMREDREISNRVANAEQMLVTVEALRDALKVDPEDFLPTLLEDYIEALGEGVGEALYGFEASDVALHTRLVKRGRQHYACYPELAEIADPGNTRHIPDDFPFTLPQLSAELHGIVYSDDGLSLFTDETRTLVKAEEAAKVSKEMDESKTKLARLGALVGEMRREMSKYADKVKGGVENAAAWIKTYEKVEKIWDAIKPFIGYVDGS